MNKLLSFTLFVLIMLTGCANLSRDIRREHASAMNNLSVGMTKQEVLAVMGNPISSAAPNKNIEVLRYNLSQKFLDEKTKEEYFVKILNGKVSSYGKVGDFDSAKDPTLNLNLNVRNR